jgi:membrane protease YdiL (CAAX protease family)
MQLLRGLGLAIALHVAFSWSEEIVFRGYGLDTATQAMGRPLATVALALWFALGHGFGWQTIIGQSAAAITLTILRWSSNSLWLPIGYHFGWNIIQTAIFGPPDALPSVRPMEVQGPIRWIGRPGYPAPGLLMTLAHVLVAVLGIVLWRRRQAR